MDVMFQQAQYLRYPLTWRESSIAHFEQLASKGLVTQADVDATESSLVWFRGWRDYFATTGGKDLTIDNRDRLKRGA